MAHVDTLRDKRLNAIEALLRDEVVSRQTAIADRLKEQGFEVTQSSVSRDLATLGVIKNHGRYSLQTKERLFGSIVSVAPAGPNLLVARTVVGAAQMMAYYLDEAELTGVVGTVAGDDTIFIAISEQAYQAAIINNLLEEE